MRVYLCWHLLTVRAYGSGVEPRVEASGVSGEPHAVAEGAKATARWWPRRRQAKRWHAEGAPRMVRGVGHEGSRRGCSHEGLPRWLEAEAAGAWAHRGGTTPERGGGHEGVPYGSGEEGRAGSGSERGADEGACRVCEVARNTGGLMKGVMSE